MLIHMQHTVHIGSPLRSYTGGASSVAAAGDSLEALLADLESRHTGVRFRMIDEQNRIRAHIRIFIGTREARSINEPIETNAEVHLLGALSGG
jgi:molybdopterin converting factor small subunit